MKILIVDALNIFTRAFVVNPSMSSHGYYVGGAVGFLKSLRSLCTKFNPEKIIICWEGGGSPRRRALLPEYKKNRKPVRLNRSKIYEDIPDTVENYSQQVEMTIEFLSALPVNQVYVRDCEADDVIGYLCKNKFKDDEIMLASSDKDFYQLLQHERIKQYSPATKKIVTESDVLDQYDITVENFVTARCFIGDPSDGILGIKGCGFKTLAKRFPELGAPGFVSTNDIINKSGKLCEGKSLKLYKSISENAEVITRNWDLMYLDMKHLSAYQIKKIDEMVSNKDLSRDKLKLLRSMVKHGVNLPKAIDIDKFYIIVNASVKR